MFMQAQEHVGLFCDHGEQACVCLDNIRYGPLRERSRTVRAGNLSIRITVPVRAFLAIVVFCVPADLNCDY